MNSKKSMSLTVVLPYSHKDRMKQWKKASKPPTPTPHLITGYITWQTSHEGKVSGYKLHHREPYGQEACQTGWLVFKGLATGIF